ncbi:MAG TPA: hypothetical protein VGJ44_14195 [Kribbellaceae bacterium]
MRAPVQFTSAGPCHDASTRRAARRPLLPRTVVHDVALARISHYAPVARAPPAGQPGSTADRERRRRESPAALHFVRTQAREVIPAGNLSNSESVDQNRTSVLIPSPGAPAKKRWYCMRRICILLLALLFSAFGASSSWATQGAHFFFANSSVADSGALVVNWDEAGLGQQQVNYTLSADATAIYACINGGSNHPKAANKETAAGQVTAGGSFTPENGRVQASLTAGPLSAGGFTCPSGQTLTLAKVTYTHIVLTDTTNNVVARPADVCRSFIPSLFPC